jgi:ferredoxin
MLYIHPDDCIDCGACVPECPAKAIFHENQLEYDDRPLRDLNAAMAHQTPPVRARPDRVDGMSRSRVVGLPNPGATSEPARKRNEAPAP